MQFTVEKCTVEKFTVEKCTVKKFTVEKFKVEKFTVENGYICHSKLSQDKTHQGMDVWIPPMEL